MVNAHLRRYDAGALKHQQRYEVFFEKSKHRGLASRRAGARGASQRLQNANSE